MLVAFNINSTDSKMMMMLRLIKTPTNPVKKTTALSVSSTTGESSDFSLWHPECVHCSASPLRSFLAKMIAPIIATSRINDATSKGKR